MTEKMGQESAKASRKPRADSLRNREKLLAAAAEIFRDGGPEASLDAVARRAGVGIGTLYRHFPTRDALFEAVYRRDVDQLADLAEELAAAEDPVAALRDWLHRGVDVVATKKGMLATLALATEGKQELFAYTTGRMYAAAGMLLDRAVAAGALRSDVAAEDVLRALVGLCSMRDQPDWRQSVTRLLDIFVDGLKRR
ncbi:TetR/AcrR family transcriptional regulator [Acidimangrovimonas pyrenivorans]|uniref:TetR/AcrR family transcriptional regulator n=1 Tax=Acidimangrovimonas pyrenivorans TaxID=2030798 RepID=A0ABV7AH37_9RHOB